MSQPTPQQILITGAVVALIAWRMYSRIRRVIGRQRMSVKRAWIRIVLFPLVIALLAFSAITHPEALGYLACGIAIGLALAVLGLRLTKYEVTGEGLFYTPSAHLGIALSTLLIARIAYRFAVYGLPGAGGAAPPAGSTLTPLTLLLVGTLAGYYWTYAVGLLRWSARSRDSAGALPGATEHERP
jgi:membrane protein CcdC involved in cytochrome C biogenesis